MEAGLGTCGAADAACAAMGSRFFTLAPKGRRADGAPGLLDLEGGDGSGILLATICPLWSMRNVPPCSRSGGASCIAAFDPLESVGTVQTALISAGTEVLAGSARLRARRRCFST